VINLKADDAACKQASDDAYEKLRAAGVDILYDDRSERAGVKFSDIDLIGIPKQIVIGPRGLASGTVELKERRDGTRQEMPIEAALNLISGQP
jgi:prolyl-tRNA synthetase